MMTRPNDEALFVCWDEGGHDSVLAAFANAAVSVSIATSSIPIGSRHYFFAPRTSKPQVLDQDPNIKRYTNLSTNH